MRRKRAVVYGKEDDGKQRFFQKVQPRVMESKGQAATSRAGNQGRSKELSIPGTESVGDRMECERNQNMSLQNMPL